MGGGVRLHHMELGVRLADNFPIAHVAVIRAVYFANALRFNGDALERLGGDNGAHANAVALGDGFARGAAPEVFVIEIGHALLAD